MKLSVLHTMQRLEFPVYCDGAFRVAKMEIGGAQFDGHPAHVLQLEYTK